MRQPTIVKSLRYLLFLSLFLFSLPIVNVRAQEPEGSEPPVEENSQSNEPPATSPGSIFSVEGGKQLMTEADEAINNQQYDVAAQKLQSARQVYNQLSNFYLQLFNSFTGLDNAAAESHRQKALETGLERDEATYQLALVHIAQEKSELSIPLLVQIVTSQSPGVGLGKKAYEQLQEIGFVDVPFTPPGQGDNPPVEQQQQESEPPAETTPEIPSSAPPTIPDTLPGDPQ